MLPFVCGVLHKFLCQFGPCLGEVDTSLKQYPDDQVVARTDASRRTVCLGVKRFVAVLYGVAGAHPTLPTARSVK
jgi:hypothetical protein